MIHINGGIVMAYSEQLAERIRCGMPPGMRVEEKKMMGGLTFMVDNKMCVGVIKDELMVRIDPSLQETVLAKTGCREMDMTGRPMRGFFLINDVGLKTAADLEYWLELALDYNKIAKPSKKRA